MTAEPTAHGSAPGKVILCGEHSVVYGRPAIAVPVSALRAHAHITAAAPDSGLRLVAADLGTTLALRDAPAAHPLAAIIRHTLAHCAAPEPDATLTVHSDLPIAAGLGSGAAVSVAIARALAAYLGHTLPAETLSALAYEVEKIHHGTPSGIDNTVVAWEQPVYFVKGEPPAVFTIGAPFHLLIANSGVPSSTREVVAGVRRRWESSRARYDILFDALGAIAEAARRCIATGDVAALGPLLNENHALLCEIGVSHPALDRLVHVARENGALGAKLTGAGQGGNSIALAPTAATVTPITAALQQAGAAQVWHTLVGEVNGLNG